MRLIVDGWAGIGQTGPRMSYILILTFIILMTYVLLVTNNRIAAGRDIDAMVVTSKINNNGRIVLPAKIRKSMGLKPGSTLVMWLKDGILQVESHEERIRRVQQEFSRFSKPGVLASDELVAERREEAQREMEEWLG